MVTFVSLFLMTQTPYNAVHFHFQPLTYVPLCLLHYIILHYIR